jgi:hypothetical protein
MKLKTGLKTLIALSVVGIAIAILLIFTCPFAGQIAFSTLVRQVPMEHPAGTGGHPQQLDPKLEKPHGGVEKHSVQKPHEAIAEHRDEPKRLSVHLMVIPNVRSYPVEETQLLGIEVSPIGIIVLLLLIALCHLILRQRPLSLFGYTVSPKAMGVTVFLITLWNLVFATFLLGVEVFQLKEL